MVSADNPTKKHFHEAGPRATNMPSQTQKDKLKASLGDIINHLKI